MGRAGHIYVDNDYAPYCNIQTDLSFALPEIELLTIKVQRPHHKTMYVLNIYRPPTIRNCDIFLEKLGTVLDKIDYRQNEIWIGGDFNINSMSRNDCMTIKLFDFCRLYGMKRLIDSVTRPISGTSIDDFLTNSNLVSASTVLPYKVADHLCIYAERKKNKRKKNGRNY